MLPVIPIVLLLLGAGVACSPSDHRDGFAAGEGGGGDAGVSDGNVHEAEGFHQADTGPADIELASEVPEAAQNVDDSRQLRAVSAGPAVGRRLTREEYFNSVEVALGVELDPRAHAIPLDPRVPGGFRNSAPDMLLTADHTVGYDMASEVVSALIDGAELTGTHAPCLLARDECTLPFVHSLAPRVLRRPIGDAEARAYARLIELAIAEAEDFEAGARLVVRAMLQSPRFIYRLEYQSPVEDGEGTLRAVDDYELATRLSFLVWNAGPDTRLLELAARSELRANLQAEFERLYGHWRARRALRQYVEQWLHLGSIPEALMLADAYREETFRLFEWVVFEREADLLEVLTAQRTTVERPLAEFYGLGPLTDGFASYDLSGHPERVGFLSHAGVILAHTVNPSTSMIDRGLFMLQDLLCGAVAQPEGEALRAAIEQGAVDEQSGLSQRERFAAQREDPLCAGCHGLFDPLGEPFEIFGALGEHITEDVYGNAMTAAGAIDGAGLSGQFDDFAGFARLLADSEVVARCVVGKSLQHAYGRALGAAEQDLLARAYGDFEASGRRYRELLLAIALQPSFAQVEVAP
ncbi:MAG: DUF1592 domain-containing protein [Myxococcales bacterium]|nr:DUF1592 domain-containing protein [Myxococcales bacterium]